MPRFSWPPFRTLRATCLLPDEDLLRRIQRKRANATAKPEQKPAREVLLAEYIEQLQETAEQVLEWLDHEKQVSVDLPPGTSQARGTPLRKVTPPTQNCPIAKPFLVFTDAFIEVIVSQNAPKPRSKEPQMSGVSSLHVPRINSSPNTQPQPTPRR